MCVTQTYIILFFCGNRLQITELLLFTLEVFADDKIVDSIEIQVVYEHVCHQLHFISVVFHQSVYRQLDAPYNMSTAFLLKGKS